jgi:hypothetical protein
MDSPLGVEQTAPWDPTYERILPGTTDETEWLDPVGRLDRAPSTVRPLRGALSRQRRYTQEPEVPAYTAGDRWYVLFNTVLVVVGYIGFWLGAAWAANHAADHFHGSLGVGMVILCPMLVIRGIFNIVCFVRSWRT